MERTKATLIAVTDRGLDVCAAAARISTTDGTALEIFAKSGDAEKDLRLVKKVLSSGHKSLMEHHVFCFAMENVSVLVEQFLIEFRLASFIVKSRRYVNFENAGYYVPPTLEGDAKQAYEAAMRERFLEYAKLLELGVPKEDARFVLPYCFLSNFYLTCNARELVNMICSMRYGRGSAHPELVDLGEQMQRQLEAVYPGVIESEKSRFERCAVRPPEGGFREPHVVNSSVQLLSRPADPEAMLEGALRFTGRFPDMPLSKAVKALLRDARPRELECLSYTYLVKDVSLASVTHYARHRIQSPLFEHSARALNKGGYILPETIAANSEARQIYQRAFERNHEALQRLMGMGLPLADAAYFALAGGTIDLMITMNARELLHFLKLRTCTRAQWEIRALSLGLLEQLRSSAPTIFSRFGPSCTVEGRCPEGRMSCGKPQYIDEE